MSRYLILVALNLPLIAAGFLGALVAFKMGRIGTRRFVMRTVLWLGILLGLVFAEPAYRFLFSNNLTSTEPLSLFDVMQITGIVFMLFMVSQAYARIDMLDRKLSDMHRELSIRFSEEKSGRNKD